MSNQILNKNNNIWLILIATCLFTFMSTLDASIVNIATALIISLVSGFLGNHFYKKKVIKDIKAIRQVSVNSVAYHMYLRQRGNVSVIYLLLPIMLYMMYSMMTTYI